MRKLNLLILSILICGGLSIEAEGKANKGHQSAKCDIPPLKDFPHFSKLVGIVEKEKYKGKSLVSIDPAPDGITKLCPSYSEKKALCWASIMAAISYKESGWDPKTDLDEKKLKKCSAGTLPTDCSRGLFQMSTGSLASGGGCSNAGGKDLGGGVLSKGTGGNVDTQMACAVTKAIQLNTSPPWNAGNKLADGNGKSSKGLAGYWAVMRDSKQNKNAKKCILEAVAKAMGGEGLGGLEKRSKADDTKYRNKGYAKRMDPYRKRRADRLKEVADKRAKLMKLYGLKNYCKSHIDEDSLCERERVLKSTQEFCTPGKVGCQKKCPKGKTSCGTH